MTRLVYDNLEAARTRHDTRITSRRPEPAMTRGSRCHHRGRCRRRRQGLSPDRASPSRLDPRRSSGPADLDDGTARASPPVMRSWIDSGWIPAIGVAVFVALFIWGMVSL